MSNRRGRPQITTPEVRREQLRRGDRTYHRRLKREYFEQVLVSLKLWQPPKVERS